MTKTMTRPRPYLGVSGLMTRDETGLAMAFFRNGLDEAGVEIPSHDLMVGVLASDKTLRGETNRYPRRYPKREDIHHVFRRDSAFGGRFEKKPGYPFTLNLVHVAAVGVIDPALGDLLKDAAQASTTAYRTWSQADPKPGIGLTCGWCRKPIVAEGTPCRVCIDRCDGLQINAPWPDVMSLHHFLQAQGPMRIVLQVGPRALDALGMTHRYDWNTKLLLDRLALYATPGDEVITDVLLDWSGGTGKSLDRPIRVLAATIAAIEDRFPSLGIGIAGGLSAETLSRFADVIGPREGYSAGRISIDAESGLRDAEDDGGNLDRGKLRDYLAVAARITSGITNGIASGRRDR